MKNIELPLSNNPYKFLEHYHKIKLDCLFDNQITDSIDYSLFKRISDFNHFGNIFEDLRNIDNLLL